MTSAIALDLQRHPNQTDGQHDHAVGGRAGGARGALAPPTTTTPAAPAQPGNRADPAEQHAEAAPAAHPPQQRRRSSPPPGWRQQQAAASDGRGTGTGRARRADRPRGTGRRRSTEPRRTPRAAPAQLGRSRLRDEPPGVRVAEAPRQLDRARDADPLAGDDPRRRPGRRGSTSIGPPTSDVSFSDSPIPSACVSFPGPEHRSTSRSSPRRSRIRSMPSTGSSARISTAAPTPSSSDTAFSSAWIPYERYT